MNQVDSLFNQLSRDNTVGNKPINRFCKQSTGVTKSRSSQVVINDKLMKSLRAFEEPLVTADNCYEWFDIDDNSAKSTKHSRLPVFKAIN